jgi:hypothetical protein
MKTKITSAIFLLLISQSMWSESIMLEWTAQTGVEKFMMVAASDSFNVDWGDETQETFEGVWLGTMASGYTDCKHIYSDGGEYTVVITITDEDSIGIFAAVQQDIRSLDVTNISTLRELYCYNNSLTTLDVSTNPNLESLYCFRNQLKTINIEELAKLDIVLCDYNQLPLHELYKIALVSKRFMRGNDQFLGETYINDFATITEDIRIGDYFTQFSISRDNVLAVYGEDYEVDTYNRRLVFLKNGTYEVQLTNEAFTLLSQTLISPPDVKITYHVNLTSSVENISVSSVNIFTQNRNIVVENAPTAVTIYNVTGSIIAQGAGSGEYAVPQAGVYVVKVGDVVKKVIVN